MNRAQLKNLFWQWVDPSIESYSRQLEALLDTLTLPQLRDFVEERVNTGDED